MEGKRVAVGPSAPRDDVAEPIDQGISLAGRTSLRIGRAPESDLTLDDVRVSRSHAEIRRLDDGTFRVVDLGSANGTFLNGQRTKSDVLTSGDFIGVGGQTLQLLGDRLRLVSARPTAWFGAVDLVVDIGKKRILDEVGFALEPASLLAVVGPSGCGKSTLLNALTGFRPADGGHVVFGGRDLYATYQDIRLRMGLVPQTDILHTQLTARQALRYAAELRFPRDVGKAAREKRVDAVLAELNLTERADLRIDRLSGGQRKRVSVGCELLTEPSLLFLDEPTSGLDPGNEADLMATLRDLAHAGRTIVVVTHSVQSLELCDKLLVLAPGGRLAYYGAPTEALSYFTQFGAGDNFADMFRTLEEESEADWKGRFRASPGYAALVSDPLASADLVAIPARPNIDPPPPPTPVMHQLGVLVRRYVSVIKADRGFALALAIQAPLFGLLFSAMYSYNTMTTAQGLNAGIMIWLIVLGATWLGTSNAVREIVKELPVYRRERAMGLSAGAYVMSKVVVLGIITALQSAVMVPLAMSSQRLPAVVSDSQKALLDAYQMGYLLDGLTIARDGSVLDSQLPELILVAVIIGFAALALGLLVSSLAGGVDRAATLLPIILVAQVIVSAPLLTKPNDAMQAFGYTMSAYWGMNAASSTVDLNNVRRPFLMLNHFSENASPPASKNQYDRPFWNHGSDWVVSSGVLATLTILALAGAWLALQATDPDLMEGRHKKRSRRRWPWQQGKPATATATANS
jgi:ABC-type multidrug transport system ATPase subunit